MSQAKLKVQHYYIRNTEVPFEEDMFHEFKGHRNLAVEELPPWTQDTAKEKASRRAVSRYSTLPFTNQLLLSGQISVTLR